MPNLKTYQRMSKKIVNIIIFVIAGFGCLLSLWFSASFDDNKRDLFYEMNNIKENNQQMLIDFEAVTVATLPGFVTAKAEEQQKLSSNLKEKQYQKDVFYTYIVELKDLNEENFAEYKAQFPQRANLLFAKSERKNDFVNGFNSVKDYASLYPYITSLEKEYDILRQSYLQEKSYVRAYNNMMKRTNDINEVISESKKSNDLSTLQNDIKSATQEGSLLNTSILMVYSIFFLAIAMVLTFSIIGIAMSFKSSYQILLGGALLVVVLVIAYFMASPELTKSAIIEGHTVSEVKWIEAGLMLFYVLLFGAILSIFVSPLINKIKKV